MHLNSKLLFQKHALPHFRDGMKVLQIGPDNFPSSYRQLANNPTLQWDTISIGTKRQLPSQAA